MIKTWKFRTNMFGFCTACSLATQLRQVICFLKLNPLTERKKALCSIIAMMVPIVHSLTNELSRLSKQRKDNASPDAECLACEARHIVHYLNN